MVFITAEIGINHNGDINIAKKLIDIAKTFDNYEIVKKIKQIVPEFISQNSVYEKLDIKNEQN